MPDHDELLRNVLADTIKDRLLQGIMNGSYPPGSRIVETQLARELDISQAPVREALRGLEALGVVEITPFRGARVRWPTRHELIEAYVVRSELEALGARLAMRRMTDADLDELLEYQSKMQKAAREGDGHAVATADASFHGRMIELAGNATLERVWRSLEPFSRTYLTLVAPGADPQWSADLHEPILDALRARDVRTVVRALRRHFAEASSNLASRWVDPPLESAGQPTRESALADDHQRPSAVSSRRGRGRVVRSPDAPQSHRPAVRVGERRKEA
jgi:DNA-binding GntR family transcriptional regulator